MILAIEPGASVTGAWLAAACVAAGAPLFAAGLRAWRLRRALARLVTCEPTGTEHGLVWVRGRVEVDEPLTAPLSGRPCAGWTLTVHGDRTEVGVRVSRREDFRLRGPAQAAEVLAAAGEWWMSPTAERRFAAGEALPEGTLAALAGHSDVAWLRSLGVPLVVRERALFTGLEAHVVAMARARASAVLGAARGVRTGTDDLEWDVAPATGASCELVAAEPLGRVFVAGGPADPGTLAPPAWQALGIVLGPALILFGLLRLAAAALGGGA